MQIRPEDRQNAPHYESWEDEAWAMYNNLGEFRQGVTWLANLLSRARLVAATAPATPGDEPQPITDENDEATELVAAIGRGISGQSELLRSATVHLTVPGQGWFVAETGDEETSWKFYSADELRQRTVAGTKIYQVQVAQDDWRALSGENLPVRVWRPHDRYHWQADSSTRAALPIMRRLELLNRHIDANAQSRLASNGIYWLPAEIIFPANPNYPDAPDPFIAQFMDVGVTAIKTPGSAAAAMPFIARAPAEYIEKIRHDTFHSDFEKEMLALREFEIRRLATAIDIPPEVLLGMAGMNHWGAWQVEESTLKTTATSLLELICGALTRGYLHPALGYVADTKGEAGDSPEQIVWYDISELSVRPDKSDDALALVDRFLVNPSVALRETGMDPADAPTPEQLKQLIGLKLMQDAATVDIGLELLGIEQPKALLAPPGPPNGPPAPPAPGDDSEELPPSRDDEAPSTEPQPVPSPNGR